LKQKTEKENKEDNRKIKKEEIEKGRERQIE
jgi:hypothetical protein